MAGGRIRRYGHLVADRFRRTYEKPGARGFQGRRPNPKGRIAGAWGVSGIGVTGVKVWLSKSGYWTATKTAAGRWIKPDAENRAAQAYEVGVVEREIRVEPLSGKPATPPRRRRAPARPGRRYTNPARRTRIAYCATADRDHSKSPRAFAHVSHRANTICVARAFDGLPEPFRLGILIHELGHLSYGKRRHAELDADRAGGALAGVTVRRGRHGRALNLETVAVGDTAKARRFVASRTTDQGLGRSHQREPQAIRHIQTLSPLAKRLMAKHAPSANLIAARARVLTDAWLRGATQGGHTPSKADIAAVHRVSLARAKREAAVPNPKAACGKLGKAWHDCLHGRKAKCACRNPKPRARRGSVGRRSDGRRYRLRARAARASGARRSRLGRGGMRRRRNPSRRKSALAGALHQAKRWQDRPDFAPRLQRVKRPRPLGTAAAVIGKLAALTYESDKYDGKKKLHEHVFKRPQAMVVTDPEGRDLYIVRDRSNYSITPDGIKN